LAKPASSRRLNTRLARELQLAPLLGLAVPGTDMNTPNWMMDAAMPAPRRAKAVRHKRRSTDRRGPAADVMVALAVVLTTAFGIYVVNALLLR
jgi:hypothetical protein